VVCQWSDEDMSLHCPAALVLARHAHAAFVEDWFSDEGGSLTRAGRDQARALGADLTDRRVAAVYTSDISRSVQTGEIAAALLGVGVTARKTLREVFIGDLLGQPFDVRRIHQVSDRWHEGDLDARFPGGESGAEVVARHRAELESIADQHNGETVLVVGHQTALGIVVPTLSGVREPGWDDHHGPDNVGRIELLRGAEGWRPA
jgi:probable phosphoglycerate mutase